MCGRTAGELDGGQAGGSGPMMLRRLTEALILVGVASLVYWPTVHRGPVIVPLRAELPFAFALVLGTIEVSLRPRRDGGSLLLRMQTRGGRGSVMATFDSLTGVAFFFILALCELGAGVLRTIGLTSVVGGMGLLVLWSQARTALIALLCLGTPEVRPQKNLFGSRFDAEGLEAGGRLAIYRYSLHLIPSSLLGVGFNYTPKFVVA